MDPGVGSKGTSTPLNSLLGTDHSHSSLSSGLSKKGWRRPAWCLAKAGGLGHGHTLILVDPLLPYIFVVSIFFQYEGKRTETFSSTFKGPLSPILRAAKPSLGSSRVSLVCCAQGLWPCFGVLWVLAGPGQCRQVPLDARNLVSEESTLGSGSWDAGAPHCTELSSGALLVPPLLVSMWLSPVPRGRWDPREPRVWESPGEPHGEGQVCGWAGLFRNQGGGW